MWMTRALPCAIGGRRTGYAAVGVGLGVRACAITLQLAEQVAYEICIEENEYSEQGSFMPRQAYTVPSLDRVKPEH